MLSYEGLKREEQALKKFIGAIDCKNESSCWVELLKKPLQVISKLKESEVGPNDVDEAISIIEECFESPHRDHVSGLIVLFRYFPDLKDEIIELVPDWVEKADFVELTPVKALTNIDTYQITPVRRMASFLYVMQLDDDIIFNMLNTVREHEPLNRLVGMFQLTIDDIRSSENLCDKAKDRVQRAINSSS
jgi:hypothetical protein